MAENTTESLEKLKKMLEGIDFAMLTTIDGGRLRSRPMSTQEVDEDGNVWFFTSDDSHKISEIEKDNRINVAYSKPDDNTFVSVAGRVEVVKDKAKIKELWSPAYKAWFPEGIDDPTVCLLRVAIDQAEYWDAPSSKLVQLFSFVKAIATGQEADYGDHGKISL